MEDLTGEMERDPPQIIQLLLVEALIWEDERAVPWPTSQLTALMTTLLIIPVSHSLLVNGFGCVPTRDRDIF